jgi:uncharacterized OsmC-like protein
MEPPEYTALRNAILTKMTEVAKIVAKQKRINIKNMQVNVEGNINTEFLLGTTTDGRAGFFEINIYAKIDANMTDDEKIQFLKEVEERCPVSENIKNSSNIKIINI